MSREEYLAQLEALLTGRVPAEELGRVLAYYRSYFDEAGPQGEAGVMEELGSPAELAARIMEARRGPAGREEVQPPAQRPRNGFGALWKVLLAICAAPIAIPLIVAGAGLVLAVFVVAALLVAGAFFGGAMCVIVGVAAAWTGFGVLFSQGLATMLLYCGLGMLSSGIGLLLIGGSLALCGLCFRCTARAMGRWLERREART